MTTDQLLAHFKTVAAATRAIGIKGPSFYGWVEAGEIPIDRQCQYEVITGGKLIADRGKIKIDESAVICGKPLAEERAA